MFIQQDMSNEIIWNNGHIIYSYDSYNYYDILNYYFIAGQKEINTSDVYSIYAKNHICLKNIYKQYLVNSYIILKKL